MSQKEIFFCKSKQLWKEGLSNLSRLFCKNLMVDSTLEDSWTDRLRRVVEKGDKQGFELMGLYTNALWNQMAVVD